MTQELLYTSAPRGLKPGTRGFCTVLSTQGMSAPLATALEGLSGYRPLFPADDAQASRNPVNWSHLRLHVGGQTLHILSRIADYGVDYSQRANKLAHHVVLDRKELVPAGPAAVLALNNFSRTSWEGEPRLVATGPQPQGATSTQGVCRHWQSAMGDAGWAGVIADAFLKDPLRPVILLYQPGQEVLPLFAEAISLLPPEKRWEVTFSTYFTGLAAGTQCAWRAMIHDSKEAHESLRFVNALRIDLTKPAPTQEHSELITAARTGHRPQVPQPAVVEAVYPLEEATPPIPGQPPLPGPTGKAEIGTYSLKYPASQKLPGLPELKGKRASSKGTTGRRWKAITAIALLLLVMIGGSASYCVYIQTGIIQPTEIARLATSDDAELERERLTVHSEKKKTPDSEGVKAESLYSGTQHNSTMIESTDNSTQANTSTTLGEKNTPTNDAEQSSNNIDSSDNNNKPSQHKSINLYHASLDVTREPNSTKSESINLCDYGKIRDDITAEHLYLFRPPWLNDISVKKYDPRKVNERVIEITRNNSPSKIATIKLNKKNGKVSLKLTLEDNLSSEYKEQLRWCAIAVSDSGKDLIRTGVGDNDKIIFLSEWCGASQPSLETPDNVLPAISSLPLAHIAEPLGLPYGRPTQIFLSKLVFQSNAPTPHRIEFLLDENLTNSDFKIEVQSEQGDGIIRFSSKTISQKMDVISEAWKDIPKFYLQVRMFSDTTSSFGPMELETNHNEWFSCAKKAIDKERERLADAFESANEVVNQNATSITSVFSPDVVKILYRDKNKSLSKWDYSEDQKILLNEALRIALAYKMPGKYIDDGKARIKDGKTRDQVDKVLSGHFDEMSKFLKYALIVIDLHENFGDATVVSFKSYYEMYCSDGLGEVCIRRPVAAIPDPFSTGGQP